MMLCSKESEHTSLISFMLLTILIRDMVPVSNALPLFSLSRCTCTSDPHSVASDHTAGIREQHMHAAEAEHMYLIYEHQRNLQAETQVELYFLLS